ncbi:hypothetical protein EJB05_24520 [Eragrostis curvula]|uniref:Knottin scorpion toxin-like domain-containing protein n=1 Tax=Eragrostis curvula TaxID=38414 RepID=A0A5J9VBB2_9POAL|nr:hypothetical protein EJB05_24514 [Eragrostis curvula]TVU32764.1 hypothetical protein EJB05_24520 [Eragrostis curvula]
MASKIFTRVVTVIMILELLILLSSVGAQPKKPCGVFVSEDPLCFAANKDACDTWCFHKGFDSGTCYAGPNDGDKTCICVTPCSKDQRQETARPATAVAEMTGRP